MKKAEMNFQLILFILAGFFLVSAAFVFVPKTIDTAKEFFEVLGFEFEEQTVPDQVIDEERIGEDTEPIKVGVVSVDSMSGLTWIKKQAYGQGWNLEYDEHELYTKYQMNLISLSDIPENMVVLPNKALATILASEDLRGSIKIDGKNYIHIPQQHDFQWFKDTNNNEEYDIEEEFTDTNNNGCWDEGEPLTDANNNKEYDGECILVEDLTKIILADLYTQATEE